MTISGLLLSFMFN